MKKMILFFCVIVGFLKADDLLFKLSQGALNENMVGVKKLNEKEMREVRGGYYVKFKPDYLNNQLYAVGLYSRQELGNISRGMCGIDVDECANPSRQRFVDWSHIIDHAYEFLPVYMVKKTVQTTRFGRTYDLFSYRVGAIDGSGQIYIFDSARSGLLLNYNSVIREIAGKYKNSMESIIKSWNIRR